MNETDKPADVAPLERPVRPLDPERNPVDYAEWLADKLPNTNDYGKEAALLLVKQAREIVRLRGELACAAQDCFAAEQERDRFKAEFIASY